MLLTSRNGRRTMSVAASTRDRVIDYISRNHGKTVPEYANETLVSEPAINLIIELYLLPVAAEGGIAVSYHGRKPDWYYFVDPAIVPMRKTKRKPTRVNLRDISDRQLRLDYVGLVNLFDSNSRRVSPARRDKLRREYMERVNYVGGSHQSTIDEANDLVARLENKMQGMEEAIQVMASAMTGMSIKALA